MSEKTQGRIITAVIGALLFAVLIEGAIFEQTVRQVYPGPGAAATPTAVVVDGGCRR